MGLYNRYVLTRLGLWLTGTMCILSFVMLSAYFVRLFDLITRGISPLLVLQIVLLMLPDMLRFALPFAMLLATVMTFTGMAASGEIQCMKASGISLVQVAAPGLLLGVVVGILNLGNVMVVSPLFRNQAEILRKSLQESKDVLAMLEPGQPLKISSRLHIVVGSRQGNVLRDVHIYEYNPERGALTDVVAQTGVVNHNPENGSYELHLSGFSMAPLQLAAPAAAGSASPELESLLPPAGGEFPYLSSQSATLSINLQEGEGRWVLSRKDAAMNVKTLFAEIRLGEAEGRPVRRYWIELHRRLSLSVAPLSFFVLGLSSSLLAAGKFSRHGANVTLGIVVGLALGALFYGFIQAAEVYEKQDNWLSQFFYLAPNLLYQGAGLFFIVSKNRV